MLLKIFAKFLNNVGLGIFINSLYGISDGNVELFNIIDIIVSIPVMIIGIIIEEKNKE